jgi:hypothetical protein
MSEDEDKPAEAVPGELTPHQKSWETRRKAPKTPGDWLRKIKAEREQVSNAVADALGSATPSDAARTLCAMARHRTTYIKGHDSARGYLGYRQAELEEETGLDEAVFAAMNKGYYFIKWKQVGPDTYWTLTYRGWVALQMFDYYEWKKLYETEQAEALRRANAAVMNGIRLGPFGKAKLESVAEEDTASEPVKARPES